MNIGNKNISSLYFGDKPISKIFLGNAEVYHNSGISVTTVTIQVNEQLPALVYVGVINRTTDMAVTSFKPTFDTTTAEIIYYAEDTGYKIQFNEAGTFHIYFNNLPYTNDLLNIFCYFEEGDGVIQALSINGLKNINCQIAPISIMTDTRLVSFVLDATGIDYIYLNKNIQNFSFSTDRALSVNPINTVEVSPQNSYLIKHSHSIYKVNNGALVWYSANETSKALHIKNTDISGFVLSLNNYLETLIIDNSILNTRLFTAQFPNIKRIIVKENSILAKPNWYKSYNGQIYNDNKALWVTTLTAKPDTWYKNNNSSYGLSCRYGVLTLEQLSITEALSSDNNDYYMISSGTGKKSSVDFVPVISNSSTSSSYYTKYWLSLNADVWPQTVYAIRKYTSADIYNIYSNTLQTNGTNKVQFKRIYLTNRYAIVYNGIAPHNSADLQAVFVPKNTTISSANNKFSYPNAILFCEASTPQAWISNINVKNVIWGSTEEDFWNYNIN